MAANYVVNNLKAMPACSPVGRAKALDFGKRHYTRRLLSIAGHMDQHTQLCCPTKLGLTVPLSTPVRLGLSLAESASSGLLRALCFEDYGDRSPGRRYARARTRIMRIAIAMRHNDAIALFQ